MKPFPRLLAILSVLTLLSAPACVGTQTGSPTPPPATTAPATNTAQPTIPATETLAPTETPEPTEVPATETPSPTATGTPAGAPDIRLLQMLDAQNGWGLGEQSIFRTSDGGSHWANVTPQGELVFFLSSFFLDAQTAWVYAPGTDPTSGTMYRTSDGGAAWQSAPVPFAGGMIFFLDHQAGWVLAATDCGAGSCGGALYQTIDGGSTWTSIHTINASNNNDPNKIPLSGHKTGPTFRDADHGWVGGNIPMDAYVYLFTTQDGGQTWQHQDLDLPSGFENSQTIVDAPRFFTPQDGILPVGLFTETLQRVFYVTQDGGVTWTATTPVENSGVYSCATMQDCWVWDGDTMNVTHDSGQTWTDIAPNINLSQTIAQLDFVDPQNGWAISRDARDQSKLYHSGDGGLTWVELLPEPEIIS